MSIRPDRRRFLLATAAVGIVGIALVEGQQSPVAVYNAEQAAAGRAAYQATCAACHQPDLSGRNEAPPLAGGNFQSTWRTRSTRDLFEYMQSTMPPAGTSLTADQYLAITAFILQSNGAPAGAQALTPTTAVAIGTIAGATAAPAPSQNAAAGGRGAGGQRGG